MRMRYERMREDGRLPHRENFRKNDHRPLPGASRRGPGEKGKAPSRIGERIQDRRIERRQDAPANTLEPSRRPGNRTFREKTGDPATLPGKPEGSPSKAGPNSLERTNEGLQSRKGRGTGREAGKPGPRDRLKERADQQKERRRGALPPKGQEEGPKKGKKDQAEPSKGTLDIQKIFQGAAAKDKGDKKGVKHPGQKEGPKDKKDPKKNRRKPGDKKEDVDHDPPNVLKRPNPFVKP